MTPNDLPWSPGDAMEAASETARGNAEAAVDYSAQASAIEPSRVLVLDSDDQLALLGIFREVWQRSAPFAPRDEFMRRFQEGEGFTDEIDEIARITLRKRRLETEIKRINMRIADLTEPAVDRLAEFGAKRMKHEGTGATIIRDDQVRLGHRDPDWGSEQKAIAKDAAGDVLAAQADTADFVQAGWNHRRVEAYYRELYLQRVETEASKPEAERRPVDADDVIPEAMRPFYRLNVAPRIKVNAG